MGTVAKRRGVAQWRRCRVEEAELEQGRTNLVIPEPVPHRDHG